MSWKAKFIMLVNLKKYMKNSFHRRIVVLTIFILLSLLSVIYLWHFHEVYFNTDYTFHLARIRSIDNSLLHGHFPLISWGVSVPYGTAMSFYPWLTLFPLALLGLIIHNAVDLFYLILFCVYLVTYLISYYSYRVYEQSVSHDLVFSILYTSSSIVYDWAVHSGNIGVILAIAFLPMAWIGFLEVFEHHQHWLMMTVGVILVIMSHLITGGLLILVMLILGIANINKLNLKIFAKIIAGIAIFIIVTSIFWLPDLDLNHGIVTPYITKNMYTGIIVWSGTFYNYLYGIVDIVGLLAIVNVRHESFHLVDGEIWAMGLIMLLTNVTFISHLLIRYIPLILHLQFFYRFGIISHLLFTFIGVKWLTGYYTPVSKSRVRSPLYAIMVLALFTPLINQVGTHFLFQKRPIITASNYMRLMNKGNSQAKFDEYSYSSMKHNNINYDYSPSKKIAQNQVFDMKKQAQIYRHNKMIGLRHYIPTDQGITFKSPTNESIQLPIMLYHQFHYQFTLNGKILSKRYVNQHLTKRTHELVLKNLPINTNRLSLKAVKWRWHN